MGGVGARGGGECSAGRVGVHRKGQGLRQRSSSEQGEVARCEGLRFRVEDLGRPEQTHLRRVACT